MDNITYLMKNAIDAGCTRKEEPIKFNITKAELEAIAAIGECVTLEITRTGLGTIIRASIDWDGPFIDVTNYGSF
jgi:hypothetical protein